LRVTRLELKFYAKYSIDQRIKIATKLKPATPRTTIWNVVVIRSILSSLCFIIPS